MDDSIKRAVAQEIQKGFYEHVIDVGTAEAWSKHYFWPWYFSARSAGRDCSLKAFFSAIPERNLKTADQNAEIVLPEHAALLEEIAALLEKDESTPATTEPAPATENISFKDVDQSSEVAPKAQPFKKSKKR